MTKHKKRKKELEKKNLKETLTSGKTSYDYVLAELLLYKNDCYQCGLQIQHNPIIVLMIFFTELGDLKIHTELKRSPNDQRSPQH